MRTVIETFDMTNILQPAQNPQDARQDAVKWGPNLTILKGQAVGIKTADKLAYGYNSGSAANDVQTVNFNIASTGGNVTLVVPKANGAMVQTVPAAWSATDATYLSNIQSALDTATGVANGIVVTAIPTVDTDLGFVLTFSGTGYAGLAQPAVRVDGTLPTSSTSWNVVHTTTGGVSDGTEKWVGFAMYSFITDANSLVYYVTGPQTAVASARTGPWATSPIWRTGIFNPVDLLTGTGVAQVSTLTPTGTIAVADVYTLTFTDNAGNTYVYTATTTAGTNTNVVSQFKAALAAGHDPVSNFITFTGTTTLIMTATRPGVAFTVASAVVTASSGGTVPITSTTAASGISLAAIQSSVPGTRLLQNGFWKIQ